MRITATPTTATLTGVWTVVGLSSAFFQTLPFFLTALIFFFGPVFLFVIGPDSLKQTVTPQRSQLDIVKPVWLRMLCWFLGGALLGTPLIHLVRIP